MSRTATVLASAVALALVLASIASANRHPDAPPETEQFAFLIGEWECEIRAMSPSGQLGEPTQAKWAGKWDLGGWAIRDDWSSPFGLGFNIRSFNPETKKWDNRWLSSGNLQWKYFEAEKVGDTMVMMGGAGEDARGEFIDRNTFHDIQADSWSWRKDRSYDGGDTWFEGIAVIRAVRAGS